MAQQTELCSTATGPLMVIKSEIYRRPYHESRAIRELAGNFQDKFFLALI